jgi:ribosomal protein S3AE
MSSYLRRSVAKIKNRMNDSFTCKTKDGVRIQLKPLLMTRSSVQRSVLTAIRHRVRHLLSSEMEKLGYYEVVDAIVGYRLQKMLRDDVKKISPLSVCEIRMMERLS